MLKKAQLIYGVRNQDTGDSWVGEKTKDAGSVLLRLGFFGWWLQGSVLFVGNHQMYIHVHFSVYMLHFNKK